MTREQIVSAVWRDMGNGPAFQALDCDCVMKKMRIVSEVVDKLLVLTDYKLDPGWIEVERIKQLMSNK